MEVIGSSESDRMRRCRRSFGYGRRGVSRRPTRSGRELPVTTELSRQARVAHDRPARPSPPGRSPERRCLRRRWRHTPEQGHPETEAARRPVVRGGRPLPGDLQGVVAQYLALAGTAGLTRWGAVAPLGEAELERRLFRREHGRAPRGRAGLRPRAPRAAPSRRGARGCLAPPKVCRLGIIRMRRHGPRPWEAAA